MNLPEWPRLAFIRRIDDICIMLYHYYILVFNALDIYSGRIHVIPYQFLMMSYMYIVAMVTKCVITQLYTTEY